VHLRNVTAEEQALLDEVDPERVPVHLAIIMDGNRRWAREQNLPGIMGHRAGVLAFREIVRTCKDLGVKVVTSYAFSLENWKRSSTEVSILMHLFEHYSRQDRKEMLANGIRFQIIGNFDELPAKVKKEFERTVEATRNNTAMTLNLAVNYGARKEILNAVRALAHDAKDGKIDPDAITAEDFERHLYTAGQPDPDLLIRTSGELRISNFLLWQSAYTEFWFTPRYWPDFKRKDLLEAIVGYQSRARRFGGDDQPAKVAVHS